MFVLSFGVEILLFGGKEDEEDEKILPFSCSVPQYAKSGTSDTCLLCCCTSMDS